MVYLVKGVKMFCPKCKCEFPEWIRKCPCCKEPLVYGLLPDPEFVDKTISYEALVDLVRKNGGKLKIDLNTTEVGRNRRWSFPYFGYGFAWSKRMKGTFSSILIDLMTTEVGIERKWDFPYMGYGYAWAKRMQGYIGGNKITLMAKKVSMEKKWEFPYMGYGYAWIQEMSGECGHQLKIHLLTTQVSREKKWEFPYQGYGFAWADKGILTLTSRK
jgi:hypothetical protein